MGCEPISKVNRVYILLEFYGKQNLQTLFSVTTAPVEFPQAFKE